MNGGVFSCPLSSSAVPLYQLCSKHFMLVDLCLVNPSGNYCDHSLPSLGAIADQ